MPTFSLFELLGFACFAQVLLYIISLYKSYQDKATRLLLAFLVVLALLLINLFIKSHWNDQFPYFYFEYISLLAPLLYLYSQALTRKDFQMSRQYLYHFAGFVVILLFHLLVLFNTSWSLQQFERSVSIPLFAYAYTYLYITWRHIQKYHEVILQISSDFARYNLKWFKVELVILGVLFATLGGESFFLLLSISDYYPLIILLSFLSLLAFINVITFKSLRAPFETARFSVSDLNYLDAQKKKYAGSSMGPEKSRQSFLRLKEVLVSEKPYKEYRLSLKQLAVMVDISPADLSQVINENAKMNFNDFINSYRVREARHLMSEHPEWLIKEVMYESGFQSTSTFHAAFRKFEQRSPSAYKKSLQSSD